jgi:hypothetical protein
MIGLLKDIFFGLFILSGILFLLFLILTFLVVIVKIWREK